MSFRSEVKAVRLKQDRIVVVLETKIYIYNLADLKFIEYIDTSPNPLGLCSMNTVGDSTIIAAPDKDIGFVIVNFLSDKKRKVIQAHQSALYCLQLNFSGTRVATASQKGTIIRIFDTESGQPLQELRRGSEYAYIYSVAFDPNDRFLAITSDSGTIHVFCLKKT
jgi:WD40 repeat protein